MKTALAICSVFLVAGQIFAAEQTWTGKISDSMCGVRHSMAGEHGDKKMSDRDCTLACVKQHNAKYVLVSGGKVYNISNQDFAGLEEHAGHTVKVTGEMKGDTITVSNIQMSGPQKS